MEKILQKIGSEKKPRLGLNSENYASGGALYFYSPEFTNSSELAARSNIKCKVQKGGHIFYKVWG